MLDPALRTLADVPRRHALARPDRDALVFGSRRTTYAALDRAADQVARALVAEGLSPGDRVLLLARDSDRSWEILFGAARAGVVLVPINWRLAPPEVAWIAADAEARLAFVGREFAGRLQGGPARAVVLGGESPGLPAYESWRDAAPGTPFERPADPEEIAVQIYTSGTTGRPKGVLLPHRSFFAIQREVDRVGYDWFGIRADDVVVVPLPLFHVGGLWITLQFLAAGATGLVVDAFLPDRFLRLFAEHRITKFGLVPAMIQMVLDDPACKRELFASATHFIYGGSPIAPALLERALATFGCRFVQIYGLTETGNCAVHLPPDDHVPARRDRMRAAGRPFPGVEVHVRGPDGRPLGPGEVGEICLHTPARMAGYWKLPDETARTLVDGWIHTGDAGTVDADGYVYIQDRVKDMILYAGEHVYPGEIERALLEHPAVQEVAVIGVPDDRWGETVKAIVVVKPGARLVAAELVAHARSRVAEFKVPRSVDLVPSLPRTASGKVKKEELRAPYWEGRARKVN